MEKIIKENKFSLIQAFKDVIESMKNTVVDDTSVKSSNLPHDGTAKIEEYNEQLLESAVIYEDIPTRKNPFKTTIKKSSAKAAQTPKKDIEDEREQ